MRPEIYKTSYPRTAHRGKYSFRGGFLVATCLCATAILACATGCATFTPCGAEDRWTGRDKAEHFVAALALGAAGASIASDGSNDREAAAVGVAVAMTWGFGKETYDARIKKTCWSWKDLAWDVLGASAGATLAVWAED